MTLVRAYIQADFPALLKWQALAFMRVEWPFIFTGPGKFTAETYPPECSPIHFAASEGDTLLSYAAILRLTLAHVPIYMCRVQAVGGGRRFGRRSPGLHAHPHTHLVPLGRRQRDAQAPEHAGLGVLQALLLQ